MNYSLVLRLLGNLCSAFTVIMALPLLVALAIDRGSIMAIVNTMIISGGCAYFMKRSGSGRMHKRMSIREAICLIGCGWIMVCLMGALPYLFTGSLGVVAAVFESVSGFTTAGVTTAHSFSEFPPSILVWRALTHWCGGIGVIMLFIIIMPQMSGGTGFLFNAELPGAMTERTLPKIKESARLILYIYVSLTLAEIVLLLLAGVDFLQSVNLALATMATGGFSYYTDSLIAFRSVFVEIIAVVFMLISSMNFSLYYKMWRGDWAAFRRDREHRYYLGMLLIAFAAVSANLYLSGCMDLAGSLRHGLFQVVSIGSTTGFASADYNSWPSFSRYILFLLMFVGGCGGSTAGGIKISRMVILLKASWAELLRTLHPRLVYSVKFGEKVIEPTIVASVTRFFFLYILVFIVLSILISLSGLSVMDSMSLIAACLSSVGPAFGIVGPTSTYSGLSSYAQFISILAMLMGRLEIFSLLIVLQPEFWQTKKNW